MELGAPAVEGNVRAGEAEAARAALVGADAEVVLLAPEHAAVLEVAARRLEVRLALEARVALVVELLAAAVEGEEGESDFDDLRQPSEAFDDLLRPSEALDALGDVASSLGADCASSDDDDLRQPSETFGDLPPLGGEQEQVRERFKQRCFRERRPCGRAGCARFSAGYEQPTALVATPAPTRAPAAPGAAAPADAPASRPKERPQTGTGSSCTKAKEFRGVASLN